MWTYKNDNNNNNNKKQGLFYSPSPIKKIYSLDIKLKTDRGIEFESCLWRKKLAYIWQNSIIKAL